MDLKQFESEIESLIVDREYKQVITQVKKYLIKNNKNSELRIRAVNWYRRIGEGTLALYILNKEIEGTVDFETPLGEEQLLLCRILNGLGASKYALRILSKINKEKVPNRLLGTIGGIYLSNYYHKEALPFFERAIKTHSNQDSDTYKLASISKADALVGISEFDKAISIAEKIYLKEKNQLIKFIAASALGEYLIKAGDFKKALIVLENFSGYIKADDRTNDAGFFYKWLGVASLMNGNMEGALKALNNAFVILYNARNKPETWLEVLYWLGKAKEETLPNEWLTLLSYPSLNFTYDKELKKILGNRIIHIANNSLAASDYAVTNKNSNWIINNYTDTELKSGKAVLGVSLSAQLISILIRAGDKKISRYRLIETLWPDELFSFVNLDLRFKNLIFETRQRGVKIECDKGSVSIKQTKKIPQIIFHPEISITGLDFLLKYKNVPFKRSTVENYFKIGKTKAVELMNMWINKKIISPSKEKPYIYFFSQSDLKTI